MHSSTWGREVEMKTFVLLLVVTALGGCTDGDTVLGDATDAAPAPYPVYSAQEVAAAQVLCQAIPSAVVDVTSVAQEKSLLVGSWMSCLGPADAADAGGDAGDAGVPASNVAGMQFTENDEYRDLVIDAQGNLTNGVSTVNPGDGPLLPSTAVDGGADGARIRYYFEPFTSAADNNVSGFIEIEWASGATGGTYATFESSPRRFVGTSGITYVYLGP